jgi:hypothetical protein
MKLGFLLNSISRSAMLLCSILHSHALNSQILMKWKKNHQDKRRRIDSSHAMSIRHTDSNKMLPSGPSYCEERDFIFFIFKNYVHTFKDSGGKKIGFLYYENIIKSMKKNCAVDEMNTQMIEDILELTK